MLSLALALSVWSVGAPAPAEAQVADEAAPALARSTLRVGPGFEGQVRVRDPDGSVVVSVELHPRDQVELDLPSGEYRLEEPKGASKDLTLLAGALHVHMGPEPLPPASTPPAAVAASHSVAGAPVAKEPELPLDPGGAAVASLLLPGLGQMINGRRSTGVGILLGSIALGATSLMAGTPPTDPTRQDFINESARLTGFTLSSAAFQLLWAGQIMHAYRDAKGAKVVPRVDHRVALEFTRNATVGAAPGPGSVQYLRDWSLSILGQPADRVQFGVSDLSFHSDPSDRHRTLQGGLRAGYRVFERRALWMNLSGGLIAQLTLRPNPLWGIAGAGPQARSDVAGSTSFYAQYDLRVFILDRWSLNIMPRFFVPLGTRQYQDGRSVSSASPSFELGTGVGVLF